MAYRDPADPRAKESRRKHYEANRAAYKANAVAARAALQAEVIALKEADPCADCGEFYPHYVMDFDHVRGEKVGNISRLVTQGSRRKLLEEIAKCELVCSNCHRVRTHRRGQN